MEPSHSGLVHHLGKVAGSRSREFKLPVPPGIFKICYNTNMQIEKIDIKIIDF